MKNPNICEDLNALTTVKIAKQLVCAECIKLGTDWVHLRTCQTCGVTLCCDSSPEQHMTHHCSEESHPVVISSEPGERWLYCYKHDQMVEY